jgi:MYXO-CTERM domain-containing protein
LAQEGDRLTKLTLTFSYGSTDPDVGLSLASASDYRETKYVTQYVSCIDAGADAAVDATPPPVDWRPAVDATRPVQDTGSESDVQPVPVPDAGFKLDTAVQVVVDARPRSGPDVGLKQDTAVQVVADARPSPDTGSQMAPDAGVGADARPVLASADAAATPGTPDAPTPDLPPRGSGCSVAGNSTSGSFFALGLLILAGRLRRRRRS